MLNNKAIVTRVRQGASRSELGKTPVATRDIYVQATSALGRPTYGRVLVARKGKPIPAQYWSNPEVLSASVAANEYDKKMLEAAQREAVKAAPKSKQRSPKKPDAGKQPKADKKAKASKQAGSEPATAESDAGGLFDETSRDDLEAQAAELGIELTGDETPADIRDLIEAHDDEG